MPTDFVTPSAAVRDLGIHLNSDKWMSSHVRKTVSTCYCTIVNSRLKLDKWNLWKSHMIIRLLNYFHISTCQWSAADLSTTINFNIIQTRRVISVESRAITSKSRVESESYRSWDLSRVASHQNVIRVTTQVESRVASPQLWFTV